jgi:hypothetical protein
MNILETNSERLLIAVRALLERKAIVSTAEVQERMAITDAASPGQGSRMVARAWVDPAYRALMHDARNASVGRAGEHGGGA